jgi:DNA polymerase-3 subunit epsilon
VGPAIALTEETFVAIDIETSGKYPLEAEICEVAAVRARGGRVLETFHSLVKPKRPMSDEVIRIHNITNEMVATAPPIEDVIGPFAAFLSHGPVVAHHAPFDMGFLAAEMESAGVPLPQRGGFCTSLLAQRFIDGTENFKLGTLVAHLGIPLINHHRATDDAEACLMVFWKCVERFGWDRSADDLAEAQGGPLAWSRFSVEELRRNAALAPVIAALRSRAPVEISYAGGSRPGQPRTIFPIGLVRNPKGDFVVATDAIGGESKRFFVDKIKSPFV